MSDTTIEVKIGADTSDLVAKLEIAKAQFASLNREVQNYAKTMVSGGVTGSEAYTNVLKTMQREAAAAKQRVADLNKELGNGAGGGHGGSGRLLFEVHALFDELSSGRSHQAIGTFSNLTYILFGMNPAFAAAAVGALALGGALYYIIESSIKTENELKRLAATAEQGLFSTSRQSALEMVIAFAQLSNQSQETSADILAQYDKLGKGGRELAIALIPVAEALALANNIPLEKEFEKLLPLFVETADATKGLKAEFPSLNDATLQQVNRFRALGDNGSAARVILDALRNSTKDTAAAIVDAQAKTQEWQEALVRGMTSVDAFGNAVDNSMLGPLKTAGELVDEAKLKFEGFARAAKDMMNQSPVSLQRQDDVAKTAGDKAAPQFKELEEAQNGLAAITTRLNELKLQLAGTNGEIARLGNLPTATNADVAALEAARVKRGELNAAIRQTTVEAQAAGNRVAELGQKVGDGVLARDAITKLRADLKEIETNVPESAERTKREIDKIMSSPAYKVQTDDKGVGIPNPQFMQAAELLDEKKKELLAQEIADFRRSEEEKVVAANNSAEARAAASARVAAFIKSKEGEIADVYKDQAQKSREDARLAENERIRIAADGINEEIKARENLTNRALKTDTDAVRNHRVTAQEGAAAAIAALRQEESDLTAMFNRKSALYVNDEKQRERVENEKKDKLRAIEDQIYMEEQRAADATAKVWQSGAQDVLSAWNSNLRGLLSGTENLGTALRKTVADLVLQMIEGFEKFAVNAVLQYAVINHAAGASAALQTAANQTAATGGLAGLAAWGLGAKLIESEVTFGGVFANLAPVMGPFAAGPAAAAQAAVASADIGMYNVPSDQLALIHRNELVMPAAQAGAFRDMLSSAANGGAGGSQVSIAPTTHFHVNAIDGASVGQWFRSNSREMMRAVDDAVRHGAHLGLRRVALG